MKRYVAAFLVIVSLSLSIAPAVNIAITPDFKRDELFSKKFLYNMDFASALLARILYPQGISTAPKQVIIGYDDWLFLGDEYQDSISYARRTPTEKDIALGRQIGDAAQAWDAYFASKGVKLFRVMVAPDKGTIYPEHLPLWARPASPGVTDALFSGTSAAPYVDLRRALLDAKGKHQQALYYKTDSHWNTLGTAIAFRHFAQQVGAAAPEITWPSAAAYELSSVTSKNGGDLANFLRLTNWLSDVEPMVRAYEPAAPASRYDFDAKKFTGVGPNLMLGSPLTPVLITSESALNKKKVLWLRDSFGAAMSPLMSATFSDVLQLHWSKAVNPDGRLVPLVEEFKPDYVFYTVVERFAMSEWFAIHPPEGAGSSN